MPKIVADKDMFQEEYDQLKKERDEATQKAKRVKQAVEGVYNIIPEFLREEDTPLEEQVTKLREAIHGFRTNIDDLEAR
jgi:predicted nuclease with TOPRIM domain